MIDPSKVGLGDFVIADADVSDYVKKGEVFRLIDSRIPGEETSAVGWMLDPTTGVLKEDQAYKLPHDKVSVVNRRALAELLRPGLRKIEAKRESAEREYRVAKSRIDGLLNYESKEEEVSGLMRRVFGDRYE